MIFPSDNEFDIPTLRPDMQPIAVHDPVIPWGSLSRGTEQQGTWAFYVDDYRFTALLRDPLQLVGTCCKSAIEPNITLVEQSARYDVLSAVGRKRYVARLWQEYGVSVYVDLNVPERFMADCLLGVPVGWRAFSTRGYAQRPAALEREHAVAMDWAAGNPLLLVYGGGKAIEAMCRQLTGAVYVPDFSQRRRGRE